MTQTERHHITPEQAERLYAHERFAEWVRERELQVGDWVLWDGCELLVRGFGEGDHGRTVDVGAKWITPLVANCRLLLSESDLWDFAEATSGYVQATRATVANKGRLWSVQRMVNADDPRMVYGGEQPTRLDALFAAVLAALGGE